MLLYRRALGLEPSEVDWGGGEGKTTGEVYGVRSATHTQRTKGGADPSPLSYALSIPALSPSYLFDAMSSSSRAIAWLASWAAALGTRSLLADPPMSGSPTAVCASPPEQQHAVFARRWRIGIVVSGSERGFNISWERRCPALSGLSCSSNIDDCVSALSSCCSVCALGRLLFAGALLAVANPP